MTDLGELRAKALDERDQDDRCDRLIAMYLRNDPECRARFDVAWLWSHGRTPEPPDAIDKKGDGLRRAGGLPHTLDLLARILTVSLGKASDCRQPAYFGHPVRAGRVRGNDRGESSGT